jgi:hypothetical protein
MSWTNGPILRYHGRIMPYAQDIIPNGPTLMKCTTGVLLHCGQDSGHSAAQWREPVS